MAPESILFALRLTEVKRWGIVATSREQTVAEHSYRVMMLATAIYDHMEGGVPHNSDDRDAIITYSLMHDLHEVMSGDINSVFKRAMEAVQPGVYQAALKGMAKHRIGPQEMLNQADRVERAVKGSVVEAVVKIADLLEAVLFIFDYGSSSQRMAQIAVSIVEDIHKHVKACSVDHQLVRYDWARVQEFVGGVLDRGMRGGASTDIVRQSPAAAQ